MSPLEGVVASYVSDVQADLGARLERWRPDFALGQFNEVVGGLLARQVTLATELAYSPSTWTGHMAPLTLRAMADVFIIVGWIIRSPLERTRKFVLYGLGQEKLHVAHKRAEMEKSGASEELKIVVDSIEAWISSQRIPGLTEVELGNWADISTRKMAEEAGHLNFYNHVYSPFSACAHSMWHHISKYNLRPCRNPLHKMHKVPVVPELGMDPSYFYLAAKYVDKTFREFDEIIHVGADSPSAYDKLCENFNAMEQEAKGDGSSQTEA
jgi:hypothetical protein